MKSKIISILLCLAVPSFAAGAPDAGSDPASGSFNVDHGTLVSADDGDTKEVKDGLYLDEGGRTMVRGIFTSLKMDNEDLRSKLDRANKRIVDDESQWTCPGWVPIVVGILVAAAGATAVAAVAKSQVK